MSPAIQVIQHINCDLLYTELNQGYQHTTAIARKRPTEPRRQTKHTYKHSDLVWDNTRFSTMQPTMSQTSVEIDTPTCPAIKPNRSLNHDTGSAQPALSPTNLLAVNRQLIEDITRKLNLCKNIILKRL